MPLLLGYILLGLIFSGFLSGDNSYLLNIVAQTGIILLFFFIGLKFSIYHLINMLRKIWHAGVLDLLLNFVVSFLLAYLFGVGFIGALILAGVTYSTSSSITLKMLDETGRSRKAESDFKLALLLFEDVFAPFIISVLLALSIHREITAYELIVVLAKTVLLTGAALIIARYGFSRLEMFVKRYSEASFIPFLVLAVAFFTAGIAVYLGLSKLLGAFLAGVMLSETSGSRDFKEIILPLKNIMMPFFSFWYGTSITLKAGVIYPGLLIMLIVWGFVGKFLVGWYGGRKYGLSKKSSLRSGFSLMQRGEFSIIVATLAGPGLLTFSGIYIVITIILGVFAFFKAHYLTEKLFLFFRI